jgi:hypothetical protein
MQLNCNIFKKKNIKRFFIPIFFGLIFLLLPQYKLGNSSYIIFFMSIILYWNFPILVTFSNSKPLYYEDLFLNTSELPLIEISEEKKETFEKAYTWILIITNSLLTALLSDYWLYKTKDTTTFIEIVGISGGILKIFQIINHYTGVVTLRIIKCNIANRLTEEKIYDENCVEIF